jgi:hypothetical protein
VMVALPLTAEETFTLSVVGAGSGVTSATVEPTAGALRFVMASSAQLDAAVDTRSVLGRWCVVRCSTSCAARDLPVGMPETANFRYETAA